MIAQAITDSGPAASLDYSLFRVVNGWASRSAAFDSLMVGCAKYLPVVFALALIALWLSWYPRNQWAALLAGISTFLALGIGQLIGKAMPRSRPYLSHSVHQLIPPSLDTSFPSDHATLGFAVGVMVWRYNKRAGAALLVLAAVMAFARVFVGAHYPGDVFGGAVLGGVTSVALSVLSEKSSVRMLLERIFQLLRRWHLAAPVSPSNPEHPK
jgi:undecaprenyl-diphosphatase